MGFGYYHIYHQDTTLANLKVEFRNDPNNGMAVDISKIETSDLEKTGTNQYEMKLHIPVMKKSGNMYVTASADGYTTTGGEFYGNTIYGSNGLELQHPDYSFTLNGEGKEEITIIIHISFGELSADSSEWDTQTYPILRGTLSVTGSAVTVSGPALTISIGMAENEDQTMNFTPNADGSITGKFTIKLRRGAQILRVSLNTEYMEPKGAAEYIWTRDGETTPIEHDIIDLRNLEDADADGYKIITYSITIKAKEK